MMDDLIRRLEEAAKQDDATAEACRHTAVLRWAAEHANRAALLREAAKALADTKEG